MFKKLLTVYIVMKLVLNFVIINNGMRKSLCLSFNFIVKIVANTAILRDFKNGQKLFPAVVGIEHYFSGMWL